MIFPTTPKYEVAQTQKQESIISEVSEMFGHEDS